MQVSQQHFQFLKVYFAKCNGKKKVDAKRIFSYCSDLFSIFLFHDLSLDLNYLFLNSLGLELCKRVAKFSSISPPTCGRGFFFFFNFFVSSKYLCLQSHFLGRFSCIPQLCRSAPEMLPVAEEWKQSYFVTAAAILEFLVHNYQSELLGFY